MSLRGPSSRRSAGASVLVFFATVCLAHPVVAQPFREQEPWEMDEEELEEAGWYSEDTDTHPGSLSDGLLALTLGTIVHGIGHYNAGDVRTGDQLLRSEGIALGAFGIGVLVTELTNNDGNLAFLDGFFTVFGASLFVASWLVDVIGTFKGSGTDFPPNSRSLSQISASAAYSHLVDVGFPMENALNVQIRLDSGDLYLYPRSLIGINHGYFSVGAATGFRFGLGRRLLSFFQLQLEGDEVVFDELGFAFEAIVVSTGFSVDLGDFSAHLDGLVYHYDVGLGAQFFRFDFEERLNISSSEDDSQTLLVVDTGLSANLADELRLDFGYLQRPEQVFGNLSHDFGAFFATLTYTLSTELDFYLDARLGGGFQIFAGTTFFLKRPQWEFNPSDE